MSWEIKQALMEVVVYHNQLKATNNYWCVVGKELATSYLCLTALY